MKALAACWTRVMTAGLMLIAALGARVGAEEIPAVAEAPTTVTVAVLTGGHGYDEPAFEILFDSLAGVEATIVNERDFLTAPAEERDGYDVVLFYNMIMETPEGDYKEGLEHLGTSDQGIVVMHHALLSYPEWPGWTDVMGIADRKFGYFHDQQVKVHVEEVEHPITAGIQDWEMIDETYTMADADPADGNTVLLTLDQENSMRTIGWTREHGQARVFCLQSGHDNQTWVDPNFREVLRRGILWAAGRL
ncbi:MAG TPA: ThuA domain-containing protein [Candidatus Sumerlaeota bacterium]|nr:ThuA domain-containing protein [Candidatus Sumerlaeota bacterium]